MAFRESEGCHARVDKHMSWKGKTGGSNLYVLLFLGFLCKGLAPSFWNTKSTLLVSWLLFLCEQHQRRQNEKEQNKKSARRVQGTLDFLF